MGRQQEPDTVVAVAARQFLGEAGYWIIVTSIALATPPRCRRTC
jgi:hypothetical protein